MIFGSCKASQTSVYPIRDAILAVNHASCLSLSSSGPRQWGESALKAGFEEVELLDTSGSGELGVLGVLLDAVDYGGPQRSSCGPVPRRVRLGLAFSGRSRTRLRIRGIVGAVPTINTTLGACEGLDVVWLH